MSEAHAHDHHPEPLAPVEARVAAIEAVLTGQGLFDGAALDEVVRHFEDDLSPLNGATVVARAWVDPDYKARLLANGTAAIAELGTDLPSDVEIRVWDSSAEVRYLVLPERPAGTEGLDEAALAARVTRDAMIGVERL